MLKKRDDFEDILEERRRSSDLRYALKCYAPVLYKGLVPCQAHMLKGMVLQSDQLRYVISQVKAARREAVGGVCSHVVQTLTKLATELNARQELNAFWSCRCGRDWRCTDTNTIIGTDTGVKYTVCADIMTPIPAVLYVHAHDNFCSVCAAVSMLLKNVLMNFVEIAEHLCKRNKVII